MATTGILFQQTDTYSSPCTHAAYCSGATLNADTDGTGVVLGGAAGATTNTTLIDGRARDKAAVFMEAQPPNRVGYNNTVNWKIKLNVTSANANLTWDRVYICQVSPFGFPGCTNQGTIGSATGLGISLGTTGVKSITVSGAASPPAAWIPGTTKFIVILCFDNASVSSQSFQWLNDQTLEVPFDHTPRPGEVSVAAANTSGLGWVNGAPYNPDALGGGIRPPGLDGEWELSPDLETQGHLEDHWSPDGYGDEDGQFSGGGTGGTVPEKPPPIDLRDPSAPASPFWLHGKWRSETRSEPYEPKWLRSWCGYRCGNALWGGIVVDEDNVGFMGGPDPGNPNPWTDFVGWDRPITLHWARGRIAYSGSDAHREVCAMHLGHVTVADDGWDTLAFCYAPDYDNVPTLEGGNIEDRGLGFSQGAFNASNPFVDTSDLDGGAEPVDGVDRSIDPETELPYIEQGMDGWLSGFKMPRTNASQYTGEQVSCGDIS